MDLAGVPEEVELLAQRSDLLASLDGEPLDRAALVEALDQSGSTVDRATTALAEAGYIEETEDGYVRTQAGRLALERYQAFLHDQQQLLAARELLSAVPPECSIPTGLSSDAEVESVDGVEALCDELAATLDTVDRYRLALPPIADSRHIERALADSSAGVDVELVVPPALADAVPEDAQLGTADGTLSVTAAVPSEYGLLLSPSPASATEMDSVTILGYDDAAPVGLLSTDDEETTEWAEQRIDAWVDPERSAELPGEE